jgi:hypothetical protein
MENRKGDLVVNKLITWIIIIIVLTLTFWLYVVLTDTGISFLEKIKDFFRFGA